MDATANNEHVGRTERVWEEYHESDEANLGSDNRRWFRLFHSVSCKSFVN